MKGDVKGMVRNVKAKRIEIYDNSSNKYSLSKIRQLTGCDYIMNGGIFTFGSLKPLCHLKVDGKVIAKDQYKYWGYAFNNGDMSHYVKAWPITISAKSPVTDDVIDHYTTLVNVNGDYYIFDMPQSEFIIPTGNTFIENNEIHKEAKILDFKPRLI